VDKGEPSFEIERKQYRALSVELTVQLLAHVYHQNKRLAECIGLREFASEWIASNIYSCDGEFEDTVLQKFLVSVGVVDG